MSIILQFFPNGEFSQGFDTSKARKERRERELVKPEPVSRECRDGYLQWVESEEDNAHIHLCVPGQQFINQSGGIYTYLCKDFDGHHYAYECPEYVLADVLMNEPIGKMIARGELSPLVYQSVESSPVPLPSRKKLTTMTKNMARNIRQGVYLLEQQKGKDVLSFLTLTLPDLESSDLEKMCERWQDATDQILKWLRKRLESKGIEFQYVYCTEIQSKRLQSRSEYAPHLHIVYVGRISKKTPWAISPKQVRNAWANIISNIVGHVQFRRDALENLQRIKFSAARYLSKYLSKGACCLPSEDSVSPTSRLRTQWGGMARKLSRLIKCCTARITPYSNNGELGVSIMGRMDELVASGIVKYFKVGYIPLGISQTTGMERFLKVSCGCLSIPTYEGGLVRLMEYILG